MISPINETLSRLKSKTSHKIFLLIATFFFFLSWLFSSLHYMHVYYGNNLTWISWFVAIVTLAYAFLPKNISLKLYFRRIKRSDVLFALFIIILYWVTHLWNFSSAPWNQNGLFDDAAWDIYFAKNHAFTGPFQAAFFDEVGYISREVVFHYYISVFFKLFGYNLLVFNFSLLVLGFITIFVTTFLIHRVFKNNFVTILSAVIINFFPLHYTHIFMGHRYAIAAPLMMVSLYFLYTAFLNKSTFRAILSALFAALTWDSAIMGKQYILGLIISAILAVVFGKREWRSKENFAIGTTWIIGFIVSATPLLTYITFNYDLYVIRERGLLSNFFSLFINRGFQGIKPYFNEILELFFAKHTFKRQFLPDFYIIPLTYYLLLVPGFLIALWKRRFEIVLLSLIPTASAFISGSYDFRVLLSVPIWVICMAFFLNSILKSRFLFARSLKFTVITISFIVLSTELFSSVKYLWSVSEDTNHFYLLPHKDVAVSRLLQDVVVGDKSPESGMKKDEFNRKIDLQKVSYATLACRYNSYAIAHLSLQNFDDKKILSFCNQGIQLLKTSEEILNDNVNAVNKHSNDGKDLKLVWEISDKSSPIINLFRKYETLGKDEILSGQSDGTPFSLYVLTIRNENLNFFQKEIADFLPVGSL